MLPIIILLIGLATDWTWTFTGNEEEEPESAPEEKPKRKKYRKEFITAAGAWLKKNPPPEEWDGSKLQYAETEMPFDGEVYE